MKSAPLNGTIMGTHLRCGACPEPSAIKYFYGGQVSVRLYSVKLCLCIRQETQAAVERTDCYSTVTY